MPKSRNILIFLFALALWLGISLLPHSAHAAFTMPDKYPTIVGADHTVCPDSKKGFITRIMPCIRDTVIYATVKVFTPISSIVSAFVAALCTIAIALWGMRVISGQAASITRDGVILAIKISVVTLLCAKYPDLFPKTVIPMIISGVEDLVNVVAKPASAMLWKAAALSSFKTTTCKESFSGDEQQILEIFYAIDCYLNALVGGLFNKADIDKGIIGFLFALIFSSAAGFIIALIGIYLIFISLYTIAKCVYIFLQAFITLSLLLVISPLFLPLILFKQTEQRFKQWLNLGISFIVQPVVLMGYLSMFLLAFDASIFHGKHSLYYAIAGSASDNSGFSLGTWLNSGGVYYEKSVGEEGVKLDPAKAAKEIGICSEKASTGTKDERCAKSGQVKAAWNSVYKDTAGDKPSFFKTDVKVQAIDWNRLASAAKGGSTASATDVQKYKLDLFLAFIMSVIVMYVFYCLLDFIPFIGSGLISDAPGRLTIGHGAMAPGAGQSAKKSGAS